MADERTMTKLEAALAELTPERVEHNKRIYADVVTRYYGDPEFRAKMDEDPTGVLKAEGFDVPEGVTVRLLFNTDDLLHLVLPAPLD